jgi:hypothetical protein
MSDQAEAKELKLLADILALVLEDQPGQSSTALDAIRRRANSSRVTGGALKNLFMRLSAGELQTPAELSADRLHGSVEGLQRDLAAARMEIAGLKSERYQLQRVLGELVAEQQEAVEQRQSRTRVIMACGGIAAIVVLVVVGVAAFWGGTPNQPSSQPQIAAALPAQPPPAIARPVTAPVIAPGPRPPAPVRPAASPDAASPAAAPVMQVSEEARRAIGEHVRSCWAESGGLMRPANMPFDVQVQVDETGTIRAARVASADEMVRTDPNFRLFAEHAAQALMDPRCATLPLPLAMMGRRHTLEFHFAP